MSHLEETVLRTESGINLNQKGEKKYRFNPPGGTLLLTDQRVIFAQSGGEFAKRLVAGGILGGIVGSEAMRMATKVSKEQLDEALQRPESFEVHLQDITNLGQKSELGAHLMMIESRAAGVEKAHLYRQGGLSGLKGFDEWITDINAAKQRTLGAYQPQTTQQQYQQSPPHYAAPAPMVQATPSGRFCPNCGQPTAPHFRFCPSCGAGLQEQPATCPKCGNAVTPGQKFCYTCGSALTP